MCLEERGRDGGGNVLSKKCYEIHFNSMKCLTGHLFLGFSALLIIDIMQILYKTKKYYNELLIQHDFAIIPF